MASMEISWNLSVWTIMVFLLQFLRFRAELIVSTMAGNGYQQAEPCYGDSCYLSGNNIAIDNYLNSPRNVFADTLGQVFILDSLNYRITKVLTDGTMVTIAGTGVASYSCCDGSPATSSDIVPVYGLSGDLEGNIYFSEPNGHRIRMVSANGTLWTIGGRNPGGVAGISFDGVSARGNYLTGPTALQYHAGQESVYFLELCRLRRIQLNSSYALKTFAGSGQCNGGSATFYADARFFPLLSPTTFLVDQHGFLFIPAYFGVWKVDPDTFAAYWLPLWGDLFPATIRGIATDNVGNIYLSVYTGYGIESSYSNETMEIIRLNSVSNISEVFAGGPIGNMDCTSIEYALFDQNTQGMTMDTSGNLFIAETGANRIRVISNGSFSCRPPSMPPTLYPSYQPSSSPSGVNDTMEPTFQYYFYDPNWGVTSSEPTIVPTSAFSQLSDAPTVATSPSRHPTTKPSAAPSVSPRPSAVPSFLPTFVDGLQIATVAGGTGFGTEIHRDGRAAWSLLGDPRGVFCDSVGTLYISDTATYRIVKVYANNSIHNVIYNNSGDSKSDNIHVRYVKVPSSVPTLTGDTAGNLFYGEVYYHRIRVLWAENRTVSSVAGVNSRLSWYGITDDGTPAKNHFIRSPASIFLDSSTDRLYYSDASWCFVRYFNPYTSGPLTTVAGIGSCGTSLTFSTYSLARNVQLPNARSLQPLFIDSKGAIYYGSANYYVFKIFEGYISVFAGNGVRGAGQNNAIANQTNVGTPTGITGDTSGNIYILHNPGSYGHLKVVLSDGYSTNLISSSASTDCVPVSSAGLSSSVYQMTIDPTSGDIYFAEGGRNRVRVIGTARYCEPSYQPTSQPSVPTSVPSTQPSNQPSAQPTSEPTGDPTNQPTSFPTSPTAQPTSTPSTSFPTSLPTEEPPPELTVVTFAGNGLQQPSSCFGDDCYLSGNNLAVNNYLQSPESVYSDTLGQVFILDSLNYRITKVLTDGTMVTIAGTGVASYSCCDGSPATSSDIVPANGLSGDLEGNIYFSEPSSHRIRMVSANGTLWTIGGRNPGGVAGISFDGVSARGNYLTGPTALQYHAGQESVYFLELCRLRRIQLNSSYALETLAGIGSCITDSFSTYTNARTLPLLDAAAFYVDSTGVMYIPNSPGVWKVQPGTLSAELIVDSLLSFQYQIRGVTGDLAGNLYFAVLQKADYGSVDSDRMRIIKLLRNTTVSTVYAGGDIGTQDCVAALQAQFSISARGLSIDTAGNIYVADIGNNRIRVISNETYTCSPTIQPTLSPSLDPAFQPTSRPTGENDTATPSYTFYFYDPNYGMPSPKPTVHPTTTAPQISSRPTVESSPSAAPSLAPTALPSISLAPSVVPSFAPTFPTVLSIATLAGGLSFSVNIHRDRKAAFSGLALPRAVYCDTVGTVYISDTAYNRIVKVYSNGSLYNVIYNSNGNLQSDNIHAREVQLLSVTSISGDVDGNIFFVEPSLHRIRMLSVQTGNVTNVAGGKYRANNAFLFGITDDGFPAKDGYIYNPNSIFMDTTTNNLYFTEGGWCFVRYFNPYTSGPLNTIAGIGSCASSMTFTSLSPARDAQLPNTRAQAQPIYVDANQVIYFGSSFNYVFKIEVGLISVFAGTGVSGVGTSNVQATATRIGVPSGITGDANGFIYITESASPVGRLRVVGTDGYSSLLVSGSSVVDCVPISSAGVASSLGHIAVNPNNGELYFAEITRSRVRVIGVDRTCAPSYAPTSTPSTSRPSSQPSSQPTLMPFLAPSSRPTAQPFGCPTSQPSLSPTSEPSQQPTMQPSSSPTKQPSGQPSSRPSSQPTCQPTVVPSNNPSSQPSVSPSCHPSARPTTQPSRTPSGQPSSRPSSRPTNRPTCQPTVVPSNNPSVQPSVSPSCHPSAQPSAQPSRTPSGQPSSRPSSRPTNQPTCQPTIMPSSQPSGRPSAQPSSKPSVQPSSQPNSKPSSQPSRQPSSKPSKASASPTISPTVITDNGARLFVSSFALSSDAAVAEIVLNNEVSAASFSAVGVFACSELIVFYYSTSSVVYDRLSNAKCRWVSSTKIHVLLSAVFIPTKSLLADAPRASLRSKASIALANSAGSTEVISSFAQAVPLVTARMPVIPVVVVEYRGRSSLCALSDHRRSVLLDLGGSSGHCQQPWLISTIDVSVLSMSAAGVYVNTSAIANSMQMSILSQRVNGGDGNVDDLVTIPYTLFPLHSLGYNATLHLSITLCNVLSQCNNGQVTFNYTTMNSTPPRPAVRILPLLNPSATSAYDMEVTTKDGLLLQADAWMVGCSSSSSTVVKGLRYDWLVREFTSTITTISSSIASVSSNPRIFRLNPFTLMPNQTYSIQLHVTDTSTQRTSLSKVFVVHCKVSFLVAQLLPGQLTSSVTQPLLLSAGSSLTLDASPSYDPDVATNNTLLLRYAWRCSTATGAACSSSLLSFSTRGSNNQRLVVVATSNTALITSIINVRFRFSVSVVRNTTLTQGFGLFANDSSTAVAYIQLVANSIPVLRSTTPGSTLQNLTLVRRSALQVTTSINIPSGYTTTSSTILAQWTLLRANISTARRTSLASVATGVITPLTLMAGQRSTMNFYLLLSQLSDGAVYVFQLIADAGRSTALVSVTTNSVPFGGAFLVSPSSGRALESEFTFRAVGWTDEDPTQLPLRYAFCTQATAYSGKHSSLITGINVTTVWLALQLPSYRPYLQRVNLPVGLYSGNFSVKLRLSVYDSLEASVSTSTNVYVAPSSVLLTAGYLDSMLTNASLIDVEAWQRTINVVLAHIEHSQWLYNSSLCLQSSSSSQLATKCTQERPFYSSTAQVVSTKEKLATQYNTTLHTSDTNDVLTVEYLLSTIVLLAANAKSSSLSPVSSSSPSISTSVKTVEAVQDGIQLLLRQAASARKVSEQQLSATTGISSSSSGSSSSVQLLSTETLTSLSSTVSDIGTYLLSNYSKNSTSSKSQTALVSQSIQLATILGADTAALTAALLAARYERYRVALTVPITLPTNTSGSNNGVVSVTLPTINLPQQPNTYSSSSVTISVQVNATKGRNATSTPQQVSVTIVEYDESLVKNANSANGNSAGNAYNRTTLESNIINVDVVDNDNNNATNQRAIFVANISHINTGSSDEAAFTAPPILFRHNCTKQSPVRTESVLFVCEGSNVLFNLTCFGTSDVRVVRSCPVKRRVCNVLSMTNYVVTDRSYCEATLSTATYTICECGYRDSASSTASNATTDAQRRLSMYAEDFSFDAPVDTEYTPTTKVFRDYSEFEGDGYYWSSPPSAAEEMGNEEHYRLETRRLDESHWIHELGDINVAEDSAATDELYYYDGSGTGKKTPQQQTTVSTSAVAVAVMSEYVASDFAQTVSLSSSVSASDVTQGSAIVFALFGTLWGIGIILMTGQYIQSQAHRQAVADAAFASKIPSAPTNRIVNGKLVVADANNMDAATQAIFSRQQQQMDAIAAFNTYMSSVLPRIFRGERAYLPRLWDEMRMRHGYLRVVSYLFPGHSSEPVSQKIVILELIQLLTAITLSFLLLALLYDLQYPIDDGSCALHSNEKLCLQRTSTLDSTQTYCSWQVVSLRQPAILAGRFMQFVLNVNTQQIISRLSSANVVIPPQPAEYACTFNNFDPSFQTSLLVAVVTSSFSALITRPLDFIFSILRTQSEKEKQNRTMASKAVQMQQGNNHHLSTLATGSSTGPSNAAGSMIASTGRRNKNGRAAVFSIVPVIESAPVQNHGEAVSPTANASTVHPRPSPKPTLVQRMYRTFSLFFVGRNSLLSDDVLLMQAPLEVKNARRDLMQVFTKLASNDNGTNGVDAGQRSSVQHRNSYQPAPTVQYSHTVSKPAMEEWVDERLRAFLQDYVRFAQHVALTGSAPGTASSPMVGSMGDGGHDLPTFSALQQAWSAFLPPPSDIEAFLSHQRSAVCVDDRKTQQTFRKLRGALQRTHKQSHLLLQRYATHTTFHERAMSLLHTLLIDLVGPETAAAKFFVLTLEKDFTPVQTFEDEDSNDPNNDTYLMVYQLLAAAVILGMNGFSLYYVLLRGVQQGVAWQAAYLLACIAQVATEVLFFQPLEVLVIDVLLPSLAYAEVRRGQRLLQSLAKEVIRTTINSTQHPSVTARAFDVPSYFFVSRPLAEAEASTSSAATTTSAWWSAMEANMVLRYHTIWPAGSLYYPQITSSSSTSHYGSVNHRQRSAVQPFSAMNQSPSPGYWRRQASALRTVLLVVLAQIPLELQRLLLRFFEPFLLGGLLLLWLNVESSGLNAIVIFAVVLALVVLGIAYACYRNHVDQQRRQQLQREEEELRARDELYEQQQQQQQLQHQQQQQSKGIELMSPAPYGASDADTATVLLRAPMLSSSAHQDATPRADHNMNAQTVNIAKKSSSKKMKKDKTNSKRMHDKSRKKERGHYERDQLQKKTSNSDDGDSSNSESGDELSSDDGSSSSSDEREETQQRGSPPHVSIAAADPPAVAVAGRTARQTSSSSSASSFRTLHSFRSMSFGSFHDVEDDVAGSATSHAHAVEDEEVEPVYFQSSHGGRGREGGSGGGEEEEGEMIDIRVQRLLSNASSASFNFTPGTSTNNTPALLRRKHYA